MVSHFLFFAVFALAILRFLRAARFREKMGWASLFLFLLLTVAIHPWIVQASGTLQSLERFALLASLIWLVLDPFLAWLEERKEAKRAFILLRNGRGPFSEIVTACRMLAEMKQGALLAIERKPTLQSWIDSGIPLDAKIRRETIHSIFTPPGALHDGGLIIRGDRIAAASVVFPLSKRLDLPTELGTRHRAGLGLSEASDALVIVVSEETGKISLADQGSLLYDVKSDKLPELLEKALRHRLVRMKREKQRAPGRAELEREYSRK